MDALTRERFSVYSSPWFTTHSDTADGPSSAAAALALAAHGVDPVTVCRVCGLAEAEGHAADCPRRRP